MQTWRMLRSLSIRNFTIIQAAELEFGPGFCAITGETGAGKSILVDALGLILGRRAEAGLVAPDAGQAELAAIFEPADDHPAHQWLQQQELDEDGELLIRRTLPAEGASRAWINGRPATMGQLRELGEMLVEIHGQHEHQRLARPGDQRRWLDRQVPADRRSAVEDSAARWQSLEHELQELESTLGDAREIELLRFQHRELEALSLKAGEHPELLAEQRRLAGVDDLRSGLGEALSALSGDDADAATTRIHRAHRAVSGLLERAPELTETAQMLETARINVDEAVAALEREAESLEADPERLETLNRRLGRIAELARKHRVAPEELAEVHQALTRRLAAVDDYDQARGRLEHSLAEALEAWTSAADALTAARRKAAGTVAKGARHALARLGMDQARLEFRVEPDPDAPVSDHGRDRVEIAFSANPGQPLQPLGRVASGGELSRLSLALIIAAGSSGVGEDRARIFDEIDAGVGGETAHAVGEFLREAAGRGQAFCVTHLAQVAARADRHLRVTKSSDDGRTRVEIHSLSDHDRVREIARMLGSERSDKSLEHAGELLATAAGSA